MRCVIDPFCHKLLTVLNAEGSIIQTEEFGSLYDANSGYWYLPLGAKHPAVTGAANRGFPADLFINWHHSNEMLAEELCSRLGYSKAIFLTSGSSAIDCALRIAYQVTAKSEHNVRQNVLSIDRCYHGSSSLGLAVSGLGYDVWSPCKISAGLLGKWMTHPETSHEQATVHLQKMAIDWENCASFIFEPVLGVGGIKPLNRSAYEAVVDVCRSKDVLIVADEITTGIGRTGHLAFSSQFPAPYKPDILVLGKGLANGEYPISAVLISGKVDQRMEASTNNNRYKVLWGETLGGQPKGCLAALEVLHIMDEAFLESVREKGTWFAQLLHELLTESPLVKEIRAVGMMIGIQTPFRQESWSRKAVEILWEIGYRTADEGSVLTLAPALNTPREELKQIADSVATTFKELEC